METQAAVRDAGARGDICDALGFSAVGSAQHLNQAVLPGREEVASDENSSVRL
jgi:hypothetical protein